MAELLHKAIRAMSLEEEEPLVLRDDPSFRVENDNQRSLLGRLLNPECQVMERMIDYMPTAWRVVGRVRGIALSRDRFQFIFQREEDLETVLKDRPWSYNRWAMVLERWTANPPADFMQSMMLWIRIKNIPADFFTTKTMFKLASEIGEVETIAYDPKVSHTKDYIRALISFKVENPLKPERKLSIPEVITIEYEYEKIHKRCFHCYRMTHEKIRCPMLRRGAVRRNIPEPDKTVVPCPTQPLQTQTKAQREFLEGPPGFPPMFPELSTQDRQMAMLYISHPDDAERMARIERVKQGIVDDKKEEAARLPRTTRDLEKGKGHVFEYPEPAGKRHQTASLQFGSAHQPNEVLEETAESESGSAHESILSAPAMFPTGFHLGPSSEGRVTGNQSSAKTQRKRPTSWRRKNARKPIVGSSALATPISESQLVMKRKSAVPLLSSENKTPKTSEPTVASVLKPLLPQ